MFKKYGLLSPEGMDGGGSDAPAGVTDEGKAPAADPEDSPPSDQDAGSDSEEDGDEPKDDDAPPAEKGKIPLSRWQAKLKEEKVLRGRIAKMESQMKDLDNLRSLENWMKQDFKGFYAWASSQYEQLYGKPPPGAAPAKPEDDPLAGYEEPVRQYFKKIDTIEQRLEQDRKEREEAAKRNEETSVQTAQGEIDEAYDGWLKEDGFVDAQGNGDEEVLEAIADAVLARLSRTAQNPHRPTKKEAFTAYKSIVNGVRKVEQGGLKKAVKRHPAPPPTGSKVGAASPSGKLTQSDQERIDGIVSMLP